MDAIIHEDHLELEKYQKNEKRENNMSPLIGGNDSDDEHENNDDDGHDDDGHSDGNDGDSDGDYDSDGSFFSDLQEAEQEGEGTVTEKIVRDIATVQNIERFSFIQLWDFLFPGLSDKVLANYNDLIKHLLNVNRYKADINDDGVRNEHGTPASYINSRGWPSWIVPLVSVKPNDTIPDGELEKINQMFIPDGEPVFRPKYRSGPPRSHARWYGCLPDYTINVVWDTDYSAGRKLKFRKAAAAVYHHQYLEDQEVVSCEIKEGSTPDEIHIESMLILPSNAGGKVKVVPIVDGNLDEFFDQNYPTPDEVLSKYDNKRNSLLALRNLLSRYNYTTNDISIDAYREFAKKGIRIQQQPAPNLSQFATSKARERRDKHQSFITSLGNYSGKRINKLTVDKPESKARSIRQADKDEPKIQLDRGTVLIREDGQYYNQSQYKLLIALKVALLFGQTINEVPRKFRSITGTSGLGPLQNIRPTQVGKTSQLLKKIYALNYYTDPTDRIQFLNFIERYCDRDAERGYIIRTTDEIVACVHVVDMLVNRDINYFTHNEDGSQICRYCGAIISISETSTPLFAYGYPIFTSSEMVYDVDHSDIEKDTEFKDFISYVTKIYGIPQYSAAINRMFSRTNLSINPYSQHSYIMTYMTKLKGNKEKPDIPKHLKSKLSASSKKIKVSNEEMSSLKAHLFDSEIIQTFLTRLGAIFAFLLNEGVEISLSDNDDIIDLLNQFETEMRDLTQERISMIKKTVPDEKAIIADLERFLVVYDSSYTMDMMIAGYKVGLGDLYETELNNVLQSFIRVFKQQIDAQSIFVIETAEDLVSRPREDFFYRQFKKEVPKYSQPSSVEEIHANVLYNRRHAQISLHHDLERQIAINNTVNDSADDGSAGSAGDGTDGNGIDGAGTDGAGDGNGISGLNKQEIQFLIGYTDDGNLHEYKLDKKKCKDERTEYLSSEKFLQQYIERLTNSRDLPEYISDTGEKKLIPKLPLNYSVKYYRTYGSDNTNVDLANTDTVAIEVSSAKAGDDKFSEFVQALDLFSKINKNTLDSNFTKLQKIMNEHFPNIYNSIEKTTGNLDTVRREELHAVTDNLFIKKNNILDTLVQYPQPQWSINFDEFDLGTKREEVDVKQWTKNKINTHNILLSKVKLMQSIWQMILHLVALKLNHNIQEIDSIYPTKLDLLSEGAVSLDAHNIHFSPFFQLLHKMEYDDFHNYMKRYRELRNNHPWGMYTDYEAFEEIIRYCIYVDLLVSYKRTSQVNVGDIDTLITSLDTESGYVVSDNDVQMDYRTFINHIYDTHVHLLAERDNIINPINKTYYDYRESELEKRAKAAMNRKNRNPSYWAGLKNIWGETDMEEVDAGDGTDEWEDKEEKQKEDEIDQEEPAINEDGDAIAYPGDP